MVVAGPVVGLHKPKLFPWCGVDEVELGVLRGCGERYKVA